MTSHDLDYFDDSGSLDGFVDMEYSGHDEQRHARRAKKEKVRKELDRRMDMRQLRKMLDGYDVNDDD